MSYSDQGMPNQNEKDVKKNSSLGMLFFIPIVILILIFMMIPFVITFLRSFTDYNFIHQAKVVMFKNYQNFFLDDVTKIRIGNTVLTLLISVPLTVTISFLFAWLSSRISKVYQYILCVMLLLVSVTSIAPAGLSVIISTLSGNTRYLLENPLFNRLLLILIPLLIGIGPLYLLFTISYIIKDNIVKYLHIAASLQIVICTLSYFSVSLITGSPSCGYLAETLFGGIYDHILFRIEIGYGSALMILLAIMLILFTVLANVVVWLIGKVITPKSSNQTGYTTVESTSNRFKPALSIIIFVVLFLISLLLLSPFLLTIFDSLKSGGDLHTKGLFFNPTLKNYKNIINSTVLELQFWPSFLNLLLTLILSTIAFISISLLSSIGYSMLSSMVKKILIVVVILTFVLSPTIFLYISQNAIQADNLIFIVVPIIFKSASFGLCIFLCSAIMEYRTRGYRQLGQILSSPAELVTYLLSILSVSILSSLAVWFHPIFLNHNINKMSLFQLYQRISSTNLTGAESATLLVLSMLIPIGIIIIFIPLLLVCINRKVAAE